MYISVGKGEKSPNTGSCQKLVDYLEKENQDKAQDERTDFFDQTRENISPQEVVHRIDTNIQKLSRQDAKYYMLHPQP